MDQTIDELTVVITAPSTATPDQVWQVLTQRTAEWWGAAYLGPDRPPMQLEPTLGGRVWSGPAAGDDPDDVRGALHGTIRAYDPPERLEIGGVLVPGGYAGAVSITLEATSLGTEIHVEQMARGRVDPVVEERISNGWAMLLTALTELAEATVTETGTAPTG